MSEKKDILEEGKSQMRVSERILDQLPGFRGYKEKEIRRESDRLIRNHLYLRLTETRTRLSRIFQVFSDRRAFDVLTDMDRLMAKIDRVKEKVNHASYGYSGFFNIIKVREENLDRMISFDNELIDDVEKIVESVSNLESEINDQKFESSKQQIQSLADTLQAFENAFDSREEVILGVS